MKNTMQMYDSVYNARQNQSADLYDVIDGISEGIFNGINFGAKLEAIRSLKVDEYHSIIDKVNEIKMALPMFVSAVECTSRKTEDIVSFTGIMTLDIDYEFKEYENYQLHEIKKFLFDAEDHIVCAFLSPVKGMKLIVDIGDKINSVEAYRRVFNSIVEYYRTKHNILIDTSGIDAVRGCLLSYDTNLLVRYTTTPYEHSIDENQCNDARINPLIDKVLNTNVFDHTSNPNNSTNESGSKREIDSFCEEILGLRSKDEQQLISSKHDEMLKIQMKAIRYMHSNELDETFVYNRLNEAWEHLYPSDRVKRESFAKAWYGAQQIYENEHNVDNSSTNSNKYLNVALNVERYKKAILKRPDQELLSITINGTKYPFLERDLYSCIVALPGCGKSSIVESICSKMIDSVAPGIYFSLGKSVKKILLIDTENADSVLALTLERISKRTNVPAEQIVSGSNVTFVSTTQFEIANSTKFNIYEYLEELFKTEVYDIIIIDDISAIVNYSDEGVNSIKASREAAVFLKNFGTKHKCGFFLTIHSNSQQSKGKGRGHLGSEIERYSHALIHLVPEDDVFTIDGSSLSAKLKGGGLNAIRKDPLYYLFDTQCGYMREMHDHEVNEYGSDKNRNKINKNIHIHMQQFVEETLRTNDRVSRQEIFGHIQISFPQININKFGKRFDEFKIINKNYLESFIIGKNCYLRFKDNSINI
jgi:hypothetical protein